MNTQNVFHVIAAVRFLSRGLAVASHCRCKHVVHEGVTPSAANLNTSNIRPWKWYAMTHKCDDPCPTQW